MNELGIYIHIPFCKQKCYYCDFVSYQNKNDLIEEYIQKVKKEINSYEFEKYNITTIYIGGGTPSYIDSSYIVQIIETIKEKIKKNKTKFGDIEITIEINPGTVNEEKLENYKKVGINRLSIGLQSTQNNLLKQIGRIHTYEQFEKTYYMAKKVGFNNINVDLMIGLPNQTIKDIKITVDKILKLEPTHISTYSLIIEEGTKIEKLIRENKIKLPEEEKERQMYWYVKNILELNGYYHYEISNFAKRKKESKHNMNCWEQKEYIGIGDAAHSYLNKIRYANLEKIEEYILENKHVIFEQQKLEDMKKEYMMLGLRKIDGIEISKFKQKYGENPVFLYREELENLVNEGLIVVDGDRIRLTNKGIDFANLVWEKFV